jgi:hypothetical protein
MWTSDGAEVTDMAAVGASPMYYDFDAFEEISITTGGNDPSIATGGMRINFVTKRGGNSWRASGRFYFTDEALQADPLYDRTADDWKPGVDPDRYYPGYVGNAINQIKDYGFEIGGPVVRDRLFVWGSYGKQDIGLLVGTTEDNTQLKHWHFKATGHIGTSDVLNFTYLNADKQKQGRGAGATRAPSTTYDQDGPSPVYTAKWQHTFSDNHYLEAVFNHTKLGFNLIPQACTQGGIANEDCGAQGPQNRYDYDTGYNEGGYYYYFTKRPLYNFRTDANSYLAEKAGDHEFKYGYSYRWAEVSSESSYSGGARAVSDAGEPVEAWLYAPALYIYKGERHSAYFGDTWTMDRMTLNLGLRFDHQTSVELPSATPASPLAPDLFPARSFDGYDVGWGWNSLSPRFGFTYDYTGDARGIFRINVARYRSQMAAWELQLKNTTNWVNMDFAWDDLNGNGVVDVGETYGDPLWISGGFDPDNPNAPSQNEFIKTSPPITDEVIIGTDYEVVRNLALNFSYMWKKFTNTTWTPRTGITSANYFPVEQYIGPSGGWNGGNITVFNIDQQNPSWQTYQQRPDYNTSYNGVEIGMTKRFSDNWMANASFNYTDYTDNYPTPASYIDPTNVWAEDGNPVTISSSGSGRTGTYYGAARWYFKGSGMYQFGYGITMGGFFQVRQGYINPQNVLSLTRPNGIGRVSAWQEMIGDTLLPTYWDVDLRAEKTFDFPGDVRLHLIGDFFNVFNNKIDLAAYNRLNSSNHALISEVMQGFTFRLGLRLVLR